MTISETITHVWAMDVADILRYVVGAVLIYVGAPVAFMAWVGGVFFTIDRASRAWGIATLIMAAVVTVALLWSVGVLWGPQLDSSQG